MGLEHEAARSARPQRHGRLIGAAAFALAGGAVATFFAVGRPAPVAQEARAAEPEAPTPPREAWGPEPPPEARPDPQPQPRPSVPVKKGVSARGKIEGGALSADATLGQAKLVRGADGELYLHVGVDAASSSTKKERRPVDFALVLDTSGSMEEEQRIDVLKRATMELLEKLGPEDRVAIVTFSTDAKTLFPLAKLGDDARRKAWTDAVAALEPRGGTNISAGLLAGADELRKCDPRAGSVRRIVLMTDGLPTFGEKGSEELCKLTNALAREGFTVSTIGLGLEYGERLLTEMADSGGGAFYGADKGDRLARIYEIEVEAARALVAHQARLILEPETGVAVEQVMVWQSSDGARGEKVVALGDISAGRHLTVVARLRVPTRGEGDEAPVVRVALRYDDVRESKTATVASEAVALGVELVKDETVAQKSVAPQAVTDDLDRVAMAENMKRVHAAALAGDEEAVKVGLERVHFHARGNANIVWRDADGRENVVAYDQVATITSRVARARRVEATAELDAADNRFLKECNNGVQVMGK